MHAELLSTRKKRSCLLVCYVCLERGVCGFQSDTYAVLTVRHLFSPRCMQTQFARSQLCNRLQHTKLQRLSLGNRNTRHAISVYALSKAQQNLQDQIRKAQVATDVLQLVADQQPLIDSTLASTTVQKLAYLSWPDYEQPRLETTIRQLAHAASCDLPTLKSPADMLAGFAELQCKSRATDQLLEAFMLQYDSSQQFSSRKGVAPKQWDTVSWGWADNSNEACKDLVTIAWAFGRLLQDCSPRLLQFTDDVAAELSKKLHNNLLKDAFTPDDLADIVDAFANVRQVCSDNGASFKSRNVGALLDVIALDVRNRLANKHSMRAPFVPGNLVKLLRGYAGMQHISSASSSMLDAAAGSVVRRMTAGHLNAVTKVSDLSQLLQAYASLGHKSTVVMPELLHAASNQLRKQLALEAERQIEVEKTKETDSGAALMVPYWCTTEEPLHLINILKAYSDLGFHPSHALLTAAEPFLSSVRSPIPLQQTLDLITLFGSFSWQPGDLVLQQVAATLFSNIGQATAQDLAKISAGLTEIQMLGYCVTDAHLQLVVDRSQVLSNKRL
ncbi:hypothetical protein ABBQ32_001701 [Trebouxia sp. C0010 RCD-2024]